MGGSGGRSQCCTITLLHMNILNKNESAVFRFFDVFFASRVSSFKTNFMQVESSIGFGNANPYGQQHLPTKRFNLKALATRP